MFVTYPVLYYNFVNALVLKSVDRHASGACVVRHESSSLSQSTHHQIPCLPACLPREAATITASSSAVWALASSP